MANSPWRKSSKSGQTGNCVEVRKTEAGDFEVRNSNRPEAGSVLFTASEYDAYIKGVRAGELGVESF